MVNNYTPTPIYCVFTESCKAGRHISSLSLFVSGSNVCVVFVRKNSCKAEPWTTVSAGFTDMRWRRSWTIKRTVVHRGRGMKRERGSAAFYNLNNTFSGADCQFLFVSPLKNVLRNSNSVCFFLATTGCKRLSSNIHSPQWMNWLTDYWLHFTFSTIREENIISETLWILNLISVLLNLQTLMDR